MAPQQELEKLIPDPGPAKRVQAHGYGGYMVTNETTSAPSVEEGVGAGDGDGDGEDAHVVIVQPEEAKMKKKNGKKGGKPGGPEEPRNCRQLETVLFFFGIAGMIVSLIMLLQHFAMKLIPYA